jgi:hypothetical protein
VTENLVWVFERSGVLTGVDPDTLLNVSTCADARESRRIRTKGTSEKPMVSGMIW